MKRWLTKLIPNVGTRSVLFGYHCFFLHGWFVARGWYALHGFRRVRIGTVTTSDRTSESAGLPVVVRRGRMTSLLDPKLWLAFFLHDLGYWGSPNMDGAEGEHHPEWAANRMGNWFGDDWGALCLLHSRFYAKKYHAPVSQLCYADKLAITFYPEWLMVRLVSWTGEVEEYMKDAKRQNDMDAPPTVLEWFRGVKAYVTKWVEEHKDGKHDTWTPEGGQRAVADQNGVWQ